MHTHHELTRVEDLQLKTLVDEMILGLHVEAIEVVILLQFV